MSAMKTLSREALAGLIDELIGAGASVVAPARAADGGLDYRAIARAQEADLDATEMPRRSLRALFQPPTEPLFAWSRTDTGVALSPAAPAEMACVVVGARPCDAAGVATLDAVMDWDYRDEPWFARRAATTLIARACVHPRPSCFCEALGKGPASPEGSDILLHPSSSGYGVEVLTEKGEAFIAAHAKWFAQGSPEPEAPRPAPTPPLPVESIRTWLQGHFDDTLWKDVSLRCLGCGACTSICPTCHCFDIVDEPEGTSTGTRRRNWDTCQAGLFTLHASGHNPRPDQTARCRQRVMHKFLIYPEKFGHVLCTGCGRCVDACPAGVSLPEILEYIARRTMSGEPS